MCRRNHLYGCCIMAFGAGLIVGHCLESWFVCCFGGLMLMAMGLLVLRSRHWS